MLYYIKIQYTILIIYYINLRKAYASALPTGFLWDPPIIDLPEPIQTIQLDQIVGGFSRIFTHFY